MAKRVHSPTHLDVHQNKVMRARQYLSKTDDIHSHVAWAIAKKKSDDARRNAFVDEVVEDSMHQLVVVLKNQGMSDEEIVVYMKGDSNG